MGSLRTDSRDAAASAPAIELIDLAAQQRRIRPGLDAAIARVLDHGRYIMGPEVGELERQLAAFSGVKHAISCSSGTDALLMPLMALGIGPGDAVICPAFTYTATPEVAALIGATPVLAEIDPTTFNLDPSRLGEAIDTARKLGLTPRVVMAVDLFGQPADYDRIEAIAADHGLLVLCDAAQSFGAVYKGRRVGQIGRVTATSFFPAKPLGCYGDGGAVLTDDDGLAEALRSIRAHGKGGDKYDIVRIGINGRLDTLQAAILIEKLRIFPEEIKARNRLAERYSSGLAGAVATPAVHRGCESVWAQYTVRVAPERRDALARTLAGRGIPTAVYYPRTVAEQPAYRHFPVSSGGIAASTTVSREVLSLPMHPYLEDETADWIISSVRAALASVGAP